MPVIVEWMVESNHDEERMARVEHMVEALQRDTARLTMLTGKLMAVSIENVSTQVERNRRKTDTSNRQQLLFMPKRLV
jgi:inner membrane protein involved in colicin E2 resistance